MSYRLSCQIDYLSKILPVCDDIIVCDWMLFGVEQSAAMSLSHVFLVGQFEIKIEGIYEFMHLFCFFPSARFKTQILKRAENCWK